MKYAALWRGMFTNCAKAGRMTMQDAAPCLALRLRSPIS
ncbi:hypothetical protein ATPR_3089 [Acetobacter tropicalis NBRC 101654]|uniref:Uncharacterized protein n=1 Tax=Acetobacter tropicalis NBRC 101654 TaxID=749388 RepID=F7VI90_9PROT|nr:hypothetical protein ATPR_3089 [Acetobacter tropicalis NBRC 101654]